MLPPHGPCVGCVGHIQPVFWGAEIQLYSDTLQKGRSAHGGAKMCPDLPVDGKLGPDPALPKPASEAGSVFAPASCSPQQPARDTAGTYSFQDLTSLRE